MNEQSRRLHVLVVSLGRRGGVTQYGWLMAKGLTLHCEVAVVSSSDAENRERWRELDIPHLEVDTFSTVPQMLVSFLAVRRFLHIRRFARDFAPDVVYYPGGHAWKPMLDLILPRTAATVLTVHDPELHEGEDSIAHRLLDESNRLHNDGYVLLNESQREAFVTRHELNPARVAMIPLGVFDDLLHAARPLLEVDSARKLAPYSGRYALFVGRIRRYKGIDTLLEAYDAMGKTRPDIPLVIAGWGEFSDEERGLLRATGGRPVFVVNKWLSELEIASLVAAARFVVLPYASATQSGVIPLATAFGIPAIASDTGGIAEQVMDGETGLLFPGGDSAALAETIVRAFSMDDDAWNRMAARCRRRAEAEWSWDGLARRLSEFFASVVEALRR